NYIYEMSVAQVLIKAGKSYVEDSEITDERSNDEVCGYIDLHNIYRGLCVNEYGMVTMPNQSYVEMNYTSSYMLSSKSRFEGYLWRNNCIQLELNIDRQNEIKY